ncbi:MAG: type II secretion system F family protein [Actinomycetia bacterium]|nr:type II secretion system F family protein [Actinomycetes bacterium]
MTTLIAGCGAGLLLGLFVAGLGMRRTDRLSTESSTSVQTRLAAWFRGRTGRGRLVQLVVAVVAGLVGLVLTGWPVMLGVGPLAVLGLPVLLATPPSADLDLLRALERWVRTLTASMPTGRSISDAIRISVRQVPDELEDPVRLLVLRLDERWSTWDALRAFADDLDSADADSVVAALMLAARRGGTGATATLVALSESLQDRLRAMREVETERAKPRIVVRQVTVITVVMLGMALLFGGSFFAPYSTLLGQVVLAALIGMYVGSLLLMRRVTVSRRRTRILQGVPR